MDGVALVTGTFGRLDLSGMVIAAIHSLSDTGAFNVGFNVAPFVNIIVNAINVAPDAAWRNEIAFVNKRKDFFKLLTKLCACIYGNYF